MAEIGDVRTKPLLQKNELEHRESPLVPAPPAAAPDPALQGEPLSASYVTQAPLQAPAPLWINASGRAPFSTTARSAQDWGTVKQTSAPWLQTGAQFEGDQVMLVTHAARRNSYGNSSWDDDAIIREALNRRVQDANQSGIPVIYLVDTSDNTLLEQNYYARFKPDYLYYSAGGAHELRLDVNQVVVAGGVFQMCLAETVRDTLLFSPSSEQVPRIVFYTDALYSLDSPRMHPPTVLLKTKLENLSDEKLLHYFQQNLFWTSIDGEYGILGWQNSSPTDKKVTFQDFTFKIYRDGRFVGEIGKGKRIAELDFKIDE